MTDKTQAETLRQEYRATMPADVLHLWAKDAIACIVELEARCAHIEADTLKIIEQRNELAAQLSAIGAGGVEALRKPAQAVAVPESFFSYCDDDGFTKHDSLEAAKAASQDMIDILREEAGTDEWPGSVGSVCYGLIVGQSTEVPGEQGPGGEETADYVLLAAAPAQAVAVPLQQFESPRAQILLRAFQEGWGACRDAEYAGEEAENDAFNRSATLGHCISEDQLHRPVAPAQEHATQLAGQGQDDLRSDALQDSAYAAGMLSGWNLCVADDHATFSKVRGERMTGAARVANAARAAAPAQAQEDAQDAVRALIATHAEMLEDNAYAYFELAYTRQTGWMAWITDKPLYGAPVVNPDRKVLANGQGDTPDEACADAARAAQGGAA